MSSIKLIAAEDINTFATLVRNTRNVKLTANDLINLNPTIYNDYLKKIKYFARKDTSTNPDNNLEHMIHQKQGKLGKHRSQSKITSSKGCPSFYYNKNVQIMSMKQFVILLEESKKKNQRQLKANSRLKQRQFVRQIGRSIQSSHSKRNMRLTSSSAHRISNRIRQIKNENLD